MYGTTSARPMIDDYADAALQKSKDEVDRVMELPVLLWTTLLRFYRKTRVLECTMLASLVVYGYALVFGMYVNGWSFTQSTYFFFYTIATIGYSYPGKTSTTALALLSLYIMTSVLVCGLLLGLFVAAITDASEASVEARLREERKESVSTAHQRLLSNHETSVEARSRVELEIAWRTLGTTCLQLLAVLVVGVAAVIYFDRGIRLDSAVLFILETITTVGFGTTSLNTPLAKWFVTIFIVPGCLAWARFVASVSRYPLCLRKHRELSEIVAGLKATERRGLSLLGSRELLDGYRRFTSELGDSIDDGGMPPRTSAVTDLADLDKKDFVLQWLLATRQINIHDVLDAYAIHDEIRGVSGRRKPDTSPL